MMWHSGDGMGWWMVWGAIMMVVFWAIIIGLVVWLAQSVFSRGGGAPARQAPSARTPLDIAKERYARGEITRDEFDQIRRDLQGT